MDFTKVKSALEARGFKVSALPSAAEAAGAPVTTGTGALGA